MTNKERYLSFVKENFVPIYSKPWWLDAVCGPDNWDVWLYETGGNTVAAMPYFIEQRGSYRYITKAPYTQTNGIQFALNPNSKPVTIAEMQERIINAACDYIRDLQVDVYEQQYHYSFTNWQPFFWNQYTSVLRYTYVIIDTLNPDAILDGASANYRKNIHKGQRLTKVCDDISPTTFYEQHNKIYSKQGLSSPLSAVLWERMYQAVKENGSGMMLCARDENGNIHSIIYLIWDDLAMYPLLGGYIPEYSSSQSYPALTYHTICLAGQMGLSYDFEGSMIQRIAHSFRQFGGKPTPYFRIRKVFNPEIIRAEAELAIERLRVEKGAK